MLDSYGREISYLRLSVTERCNLRCRYCMPETGICKKSHQEMLTEEEMIQAVEAAVSLGIKKVRITGGEPLVKKNILSICKNIRKIHGVEELCLTTNGHFLAQFAKDLKEAGVDRINISIDTLDSKKYEYMTRGGKLEDSLEGIKAALEAGFDKIKLNTVLIGGFNDDEIEELANITRKYPIDVRFIELMPMYDGGDFKEDAYLPYWTVTDKLTDLIPVEGGQGVAKMYQFPDGKGKVGLISPVNNHFCNNCNRLRLTADGKLKPCLHSKEELSIKGMDFHQVAKTFVKAIESKPSCRGDLSHIKRSEAGRNMNQIGG